MCMKDRFCVFDWFGGVGLGAFFFFVFLLFSVFFPLYRFKSLKSWRPPLRV